MRGSSALIATEAAPSTISALALAMASSEPNRSRCTGPSAVNTLTVGRIQLTISAISPGPYVPISATNTSVPGVR